MEDGHVEQSPARIRVVCNAAGSMDSTAGTQSHKYRLGDTVEMRTGSARAKNVAWKRVRFL